MANHVRLMHLLKILDMLLHKRAHLLMLFLNFATRWSSIRHALRDACKDAGYPIRAPPRAPLAEVLGVAAGERPARARQSFCRPCRPRCES